MQPKWKQLHIALTDGDVELVSDILMEFGANAVSLMDAEDNPIYEPKPGETPLWQKLWLVGYFALDSNLQKVIHGVQLGLGRQVNFHVQDLKEEDWTQAWVKHFKPTHYGKHLWVCAREHLSKITDPDAVVVILTPGLAFGTGTHPTTSLCLEWLATVDPMPTTVMDYGCGSGILAIAAAQLGAQKIIAIDNDPQALQATVENARENHISNTCLQIYAPGEIPQGEKVDLVVANILANPLISLAPRLVHYLRPGGFLVLSGILKDQAADVREAYAKYCELLEEVVREEWVRLSFKKN